MKSPRLALVQMKLGETIIIIDYYQNSLTINNNSSSSNNNNNRDLEARKEGVEILKAVGLEHTPVSEAGLQVLDDSEIKYTISGD